MSDRSFLSVTLFAEPESTTGTVFLDIESILLDPSRPRPPSLFADAVPVP
jgi:hypothetical protein